MTGRTTLVLLAAVLLLGAYIQFGERRRDSVEERKAAARLALRFTPEEIDALRIDTPGGLFMLERTNDAWRIVSPSPGPADANSILRLLDTLAALRRSEVITAAEQEQLGLDPAEYGLATPRARITLGSAGGEVTLLIGRDAPGGDRLYMKRADHGDILVTGKDVMDALPASLLDLRDRRLFTSQPGRVRRIEIAARDRTFHAARGEEEQWFIERPAPARGANAAIRQWLERLYEFRIADFVADSVAAASLYGFDEPRVQVTLSLDPKSPPQTLKIGRPADAGNTSYYAMLVGQEAVFTIGRDAAEWMERSTDELRDNRVLTIPAVNISFIQMTEDDRSLQLQRNTQQVWEVVSPKRLTADDRKVQRLLAAWTGARIDRVYDPPSQPGTPHGLAESRRSIVFARSARPTVPTPGLAATNLAPAALADQELVVTIGLTNDAGRVFITPAQYASIYEVDAGLLDTFSVNPLDYRDPVVLAVDADSVRRITQRTGSSETYVERTNILFRTASSSEAPDTDAIDGVLAVLSRLSAVRFVEEDPRDPALYGLDQPARQLIVGLSAGSAINRVLSFGRSDGEETFAMVQGNDAVFTLATETVDLLMKPVANPLAPVAPVAIPEVP